MTLDDESAARIADETYRDIYVNRRHPMYAQPADYVKAGSAARDTEIEELRAELERQREINRRAERQTQAVEATLAKAREWAESEGKYLQRPREMLLAILDESPTERETPADDTVTIPRPVVPFGPHGMSENEGTAHYLGEVVRKIDTGYLNVGGSNVAATVRKLLLDAAEVLGGGSR